MWSQTQYEQDVDNLVNNLNDNNDSHHVTYEFKYQYDKVTFYFKDLESGNRDNSMTICFSIDEMAETGVNAYYDNLLP